MLLIIEDADLRRTRPADQGRAARERMDRFADGLRSRGLLRIAESLRSDNEGVRLAVRTGKKQVLDGPFTEAKEIVGGFFFLDTDDRDEVLRIAHECPAIEWATVEVRQVGPCWEGNR